jgi:hypothetical protein
MADQQEYDWGEVNGTAVTRLRAPKIVPVPDAIVAQAQRSFDGVPSKNEAGEEVKLHVLRHNFKSDAKAEAFAKLMKHAGDHTTPLTSVSVVVDPDNDGTKTLVAWRAGNRRGRTTTV